MATNKNSTKNQNPALGMSFAQVRQLKALSKRAGGLTRPALAEASQSASMTDSLGPTDMDNNKSVEKRSGRRTLLGLGYVKASVESLNSDKDGKASQTVYAITATGKKALETLNNEVMWPIGH